MTHSFTEIELLGYRNQPIPNTFIRSEKETKKLAIIFPGLGYTCAMPLLYYTAAILKGLGFDVLLVEYKYLRSFAALSEAEQRECISSDAKAAYETAISQRRYHEVVLVGKSIGTLAMSCALENQTIPLNTKLIWFTPLLKDEYVYANIKACKLKSLFLIGSEDPHFTAEAAKSLAGMKQNKVIVVEDANHSLEVEGKDVAHNISMLHTIVKHVADFLG